MTWIDVVTSISTLVLAVLTVVYVRSTMKMADQAVESAKHSAKAAAAAEKAVLVEITPFFRIESASFRGPDRGEGSYRLEITLENVGRSMGFVESLVLRDSNRSFEFVGDMPLSAPGAKGMWYASVGVDADTERSLRSTGFTWLAEYSDFMGSRYKLEESYAPGEGGGPLYVDSWRVYRETAHDGWQSIWELLG